MASYVLRRIDDALWNRFRVLAAQEGIRTTDLLVRLIAAYVRAREGGTPARPGTGSTPTP